MPHSIVTMAKLAFLSLSAVMSAMAMTPAPASGINSLSQTSTSSKICTATVFRAPHMIEGPIKTIWTTTITSTISINCGNCSSVTSSLLNLGVGPAVHFNETFTAAGPSITTEFACLNTTNATTATTITGGYKMPAIITIRPSHAGNDKSGPTAPSLPTRQGEPNHKIMGYYKRSEASKTSSSQGLAYTITAPGITSPTCTSSFALAPIRAHATLIIHPSTITHTSRVYCGPCALIWSTGVQGLPATPIEHVATKTTKKAATETHLKCHKFHIKSRSTKKSRSKTATATTTTTTTTTSTTLDTITGAPMPTWTTAGEDYGKAWGEDELNDDEWDDEVQEDEDYEDEDE